MYGIELHWHARSRASTAWQELAEQPLQAVVHVVHACSDLRAVRSYLGLRRVHLYRTVRLMPQRLLTLQAHPCLPFADRPQRSAWERLFESPP